MSNSIITSIFLIMLYMHPVFAQHHALNIESHLTFRSKHFFGPEDSFGALDGGMAQFNVKHHLDNLSSKMTINYKPGNKSTFDGSYLQYTKGIATYGIGAIDRNWSFSNNTSLILSHNARPTKSIYLKLKNRFGYDWLPSKANWSLEFFNGSNEGSLKNTKSKLTGLRAILSPIDGLNIELAQTSQWGGEGNDNGISTLAAALFFDSNNNTNSNINKLAGFGISYIIPSKILPLRIYGQTVGEDEAGNLPSCFSYLTGIELSSENIKYPTTITIEAIDTRIDATTNGNCGPNTMYNNNTYNYTNHGKSMGAAIDTEGTSLGLYIQSQVSKKINVELASRSVVINDFNWSKHRLSSTRQTGLINSLGFSWNHNNASISVDIYNQDINLNKSSIKSGNGVNFTSSIIF
jgi:hypothetical protein